MVVGRISGHARRRMQQRGISEAEVDAVLVKHATPVFDPDEASYLLVGKVGPRTIKVWVVASEWPYRIVVKSVAAKGE